MRVRRSDGVLLDSLVSGELVYSEGKQYFLSVMVDVTARKLAEVELQRIKVAVDATSDAIAMAAVGAQHFYQNQAFDRLFGYTLEEVSRLGPAGLFAREEDAKRVFETITAGEPWSGEVEMVAKDGRRFPVSLRANAVRDERGQIVALVGSHTDISDDKQAQVALQDSEQRQHPQGDAAGFADR